MEEKCRVFEGHAETACGKPATVRIYPDDLHGKWIPMCAVHAKPPGAGYRVETIFAS